MPMAMVVTRNVEDRYRGFLTSVMLEIAPGVYGVYVAPDRLSPGVRMRVWEVLSAWWEALGTGSIVLVWRDAKAVGNLQIEMLGEPPKEIVDADGICAGIARKAQVVATRFASRSFTLQSIQRLGT